MFWLLVVYLSFVKCHITHDIERKIESYYKSGNVAEFKHQWDYFRKPLENALTKDLKESVGAPGKTNVFYRQLAEPLGSAYYHDDNAVKLLLKDLNLEDLPRFHMSEVQFSLSSNVLRMYTALDRMVVRSEYSVLRNKSDIIYDAYGRDSNSSSSPFLYQQVFNHGDIAITANDCILTGLVVTTLTGESVNVGYQHFKLDNCGYTVEIYKAGTGFPPVIANYELQRSDDVFSMNQLLMKEIVLELVPKLQGALISFINTSAIFGPKLTTFKQNQEELFRTTSLYLMHLVRNINRETDTRNSGSIKLDDFTPCWIEKTESTKNNVDEKVILTDMVVTGLESLYSSQSGGPYKSETLFIGEEMRLSTLQIRGNVTTEELDSDQHQFTAEINDMAIDVVLRIDKNESSGGLEVQLKTIRILGYRSMAFAMPTIAQRSTEALISGYLLKEVPKALVKHFKEVIPIALEPLRRSPAAIDVQTCVCDGETATSRNQKHDNRGNLVPDIQDLADSDEIEIITNLLQKKSKNLNKRLGDGRRKLKKSIKKRNYVESLQN